MNPNLAVAGAVLLLLLVAPTASVSGGEYSIVASDSGLATGERSIVGGTSTTALKANTTSVVDPNVRTRRSTGIVTERFVTSPGVSHRGVRATPPHPTVSDTGGLVSPDIEVRPRALRFPNQTYGSISRDVTVTNVGDAPLTVRSIVIVGPDRSFFEQSVTGPVTIGANESTEITVSFESDASIPRFATLQIMSDDPDEPQKNIWLTNTATVATVSPSRVLAKKTLVNATIREARANTTQSLNVSWPLTRDDVVGVDALSFTPLRDGNVTLSIATNVSRFGQVPSFALADGTDPASYIHVDHDITNQNVSDVEITFRVRKDRLAGNETGPEDVALYVHGDGGWRELPTRLVTEGNTHYIFEADSPDLGDFTTGVKQAKFRITDAIVTVTEIRTDQGTTVLVRVTNVGAADGTYTVKLVLDDAIVDSQKLSIAPSGTRQTSFDRSFAEPGRYDLFVNDRFVATITVSEVGGTETLSSGDTLATTTFDGDGSEATDSGMPGFGFGTAAIAILVVVLVVVSRRWT